MPQTYRLALVGFLLLSIHCPLIAQRIKQTSRVLTSFDLQSADSPADNPLKGLVPYARPAPGRFPHSMEFGYQSLSELVIGENQFDWKPLERSLNDIASRGNQMVLRIFVEYPGKQEGIPKYLIDAGLRVHKYMNTNTAPFPPTESITPDYSDPRLRKAFQQFIKAFGEAYDGDPRLAYVTAGLLGTWGEWHTYPRNELWASFEVQQEVLDAYQEHFKTTPILLRYPAGKDHDAQADNAGRPMGYHDDSFAWATLDTGRDEDDWFFMPAMKQAGQQSIDKWKTQPIGGEIRPEVWGKIFDKKSAWPGQAQSFHDCVTTTHATWLMDTGMFREQASQARLGRAMKEVRRMGYDLFVSRAEFAFDAMQHNMKITLQVVNQGVAPFYPDWPTEIALLAANGKTANAQAVPELSVRGILPSSKPHELSATVKLANVMPGDYKILMRVVHPLPGGKPLRFANQSQDQDVGGWLTLGYVKK